jgi:hypothetical protein
MSGMRLLRIVLAFIIFFFMVTAFNGMVMFARTISLGNFYIEIGFYVLVSTLILVYLVWPLVRYTRIPSTHTIMQMHDGDRASTNRLYRHCLKTRKLEGDVETRKLKVIEHLTKQLDEFDEVIRKTAMKLTATVTISPNSFIDGLTILLGNSHMIYSLSRKVGIRYPAKEMAQVYFNVFSAASLTGLLEEFDDEIREIVEEFAEVMSQKGSESASSSIPFVSILSGAISPLIQASSNYAFVMYNGYKYKRRLLNILENTDYSDSVIATVARKEARRSRMAYVKYMTKKIGASGAGSIKNAFGKVMPGSKLDKDLDDLGLDAGGAVIVRTKKRGLKRLMFWKK